MMRARSIVLVVVLALGAGVVVFNAITGVRERLCNDADGNGASRAVALVRENMPGIVPDERSMRTIAAMPAFMDPEGDLKREVGARHWSVWRLDELARPYHVGFSVDPRNDRGPEVDCTVSCHGLACRTLNGAQ